MTKSELILKLTQTRPTMKLREAEAIVNAIFDSMIEAMQRGERIEIRGFGSFVVKEYRPYEGRNPKTGEKIQVHSKRSPTFKVGKELQERVNAKRPKDGATPPSPAQAGSGTPPAAATPSGAGSATPPPSTK
ncbi:MAG: integration host factor subunit beta [Deltaproteobacteria bacterium]|nr:integration host factor subunit beta [Deltaproteobacteria bacterium]